MEAFAAVLTAPRTFDCVISTAGDRRGRRPLAHRGVRTVRHRLRSVAGRVRRRHASSRPRDHRSHRRIARTPGRVGVDVGDRIALERHPCGTCPACLGGAYKRCTGTRGYGLKVKAVEPPFLWGGYATHAYLHPRALIHRLPDIPTGVMALQGRSRTPCAGPARSAVPQSATAWSSAVPGSTDCWCSRRRSRRRANIVTARQGRRRLEVARELGATTTIDVDRDDPVAVVTEVTRGKLADLVVDVSSHATEPVGQAVDMVRPGGRIVLAGLKNNRAVLNFVSDKVVMKEIQLVGAFSAGWTAVETAIELIRTNAAELSVLATHAFSITEAQKAMQVLGREITDGPELLNAHLRAGDSVKIYQTRQRLARTILSVATQTPTETPAGWTGADDAEAPSAGWSRAGGGFSVSIWRHSAEAEEEAARGEPVDLAVRFERAVRRTRGRRSSHPGRRSSPCTRRPWTNVPGATRIRRIGRRAACVFTELRGIPSGRTNRRGRRR